MNFLIWHFKIIKEAYFPNNREDRIARNQVLLGILFFIASGIYTKITWGMAWY